MMRSIIASVFFACMLTGVIATETVNALENSTDVTSDDNNSSDDYNEIIKLFGEDDFAGYDDGYDEGNDSSISNNGTSLESYDLEKYLQDWKIESNLSCIVCDSDDQPSCKLSNELDGFLTRCKVDQHYCQTTIINMSKGNSTTIRRCSVDNTDRDFDCRKKTEQSCISIKSCNTDGCNTDNSAGNFNLNHILSLLCLLTTALLMR